MGYSSVDDQIANLSAEKRWLTTFCKCPPVSYSQTAPFWISSWGWTNDPVAGDVSGTALAAVQCDDSTTGRLYHGGDVSTDTKHLLEIAKSISLGVPAQIMVVDRLLYYPGIDFNTSSNQDLTNGVTLPRYTDGKGVRAWLEVTTTLGATPGNMTFGTNGYTSETGGAGTGRQHGVTVTMVASSPVYRIPHSGNAANSNYNPFLPLQAGDVGIKSAEGFKLSAAMGASSAGALVLGIPLTPAMPLNTLNQLSEREFLLQIQSLPRIYDGACLHFLIGIGATTLTTAATLQGSISVGWAP